MDAYVLVLIVFLLAWLISFLICDCEILAPPSLMLIMFVLATSLSIVGLGSWNAISLSPEAICCFVVMAISIVFGAVVFKAILPKRSLRSVARTSYDLVSSFCERVISIGMSRWLILIVVLIVGVLVYSGELVALADQNGMTSANYFSKARWVREHYNVTFSTESLDSGAGFSGIASRFQQIIMFSGYVGSLVIAACVWKRAEKKYYVGPTIVLLIACAFALLKGARGDIVHYVLALVIALFAFKMSNTKSKAETSKRFALAGAVLLMVVLVLFYLGGVLLRSTGANLVDYVSFYFGCGIPSLSSILEESSNASTMLGSTTFSQLFISLYKYGFVDTVQANASFFVTLGPFQSNVFTACYRYYADFGYAGIIVFGTLATFIMMAFYYALKNPRYFGLLVFALMALTHAADIVRDDFLFASLLSPTLVWYVIEVALIWFILMYKKQPLIQSLRPTEAIAGIKQKNGT